jgi:Xaa-Pro dipeptidase
MIEIDHAARLATLQGVMAEQGVDLLFLPRSTNLHYLTGLARTEPNYGNVVHPGEWVTGAWITPDRDPIVTLPRMVAEKTVLEGYEIRSLPDTRHPAELARDVITDLGIGQRARIALDDRSWAETVLPIQALRPDATYTLAGELLMPMRMIKDEAEIAVMRRAGEITEAAYEVVRGKLQHGMTTVDLIAEVNYQLQRHGATTHSFATAFYNRGKGQPFAANLREETMLVPLTAPVAVSFDFGAVYGGYCYDYGRSVHFGEPDAEYRRAYDLVMASQQAGIDALVVGQTCERADAAARAVLVDGGYGEAFRHRLGHAIGMDVHETPFLMESDTTPLQEGMCFTVEPSISTADKSARVEDIVVVRRGGSEALTSRFKELHVVD